MSLRAVMMFALIPLVCLVGYLGFKEIEVYRAEALFQGELNALSRDAVAVGDLIHELQRERGFSAGFVGSKGENFAPDLTAQRSKTDSALEQFRTVVPSLMAHSPEALEQATAGLDQLATSRATIDGLEMTVPELAGFYTGIITSLIAAETKVRTGKVSQTTSILMEAKEYVTLAKEAAGLERAMGATGLGAESFPAPVHRRFVALAAQQAVYLDRAEAVLERPGFRAEIEGSFAARGAAEMREVILALPYGGDVGSLAAPDWFAASTEWIDQLRMVEMMLGGELRDRADAAQTEAERNMMTKSAIVGAASLLALTLALFFVERTTRRLRALIGIMNEFVAGNFEAWVPFVKTKGEIGRMADAIYRFKQLSKEAMAKQEADQAQLNARHQAVVDLVTEGLAALSNADLTLSFEDELAPEYDAIRADFNVTVANLRKVMEEIARTVEDLEGRADTMMHSASDLAQRTTEQVAQIEATAEATTRLSEGVKGTSGAIGGAKQMADLAKEQAQKSGETVAAAVAAMDRISQSSDRIGQITTMIEDLSFQTNLLALNAGVEAARAGTSGKGFAVVATEVRALASRSSEAALEIKTLIEESADQIEAGVQLVDRTGVELQSIIEQILKIDSSLSTVAQSAKDQVVDLGALQDTMSELRQLTGQNLTLADQSQTASDALAGTAQSLSGIVSGFTLAKGAAKKRGVAKVA